MSFEWPTSLLRRFPMEVPNMTRFEILEWHDRRYQHYKYVDCTEKQAIRLVNKLNEGYTGLRFIYKEV